MSIIILCSCLLSFWGTIKASCALAPLYRRKEEEEAAKLGNRAADLQWGPHAGLDHTFLSLSQFSLLMHSVRLSWSPHPHWRPQLRFLQRIGWWEWWCRKCSPGVVLLRGVCRPPFCMSRLKRKPSHKIIHPLTSHVDIWEALTGIPEWVKDNQIQLHIPISSHTAPFQQCYVSILHNPAQNTAHSVFVTSTPLCSSRRRGNVMCFKIHKRYQKRGFLLFMHCLIHCSYI